jgi:hypothetical protein
MVPIYTLLLMISRLVQDKNSRGMEPPTATVACFILLSALKTSEADPNPDYICRRTRERVLWPSG